MLSIDLHVSHPHAVQAYLAIRAWPTALPSLTEGQQRCDTCCNLTANRRVNMPTCCSTTCALDEDCSYMSTDINPASPISFSPGSVGSPSGICAAPSMLNGR